MVRVLLLVVPLAFAGAVSPVMLTEQTVLLAGRDGRRVAGAYAVGVAGTAAVFLSLLELFGRSIALPTQPRLSSSLDLLLGALLILVAAVLRHRRPERTTEPQRSHDRALSPRQALSFGVFSMATDFTTLAIIVPVAKEIAASGLDVPARVVVLAVVTAVVAIPAWLPLALTSVAPGATGRGLAALGRFIDARGRLITVVLLAAAGLFLVVRGAVDALGW